jgi:hypothetical protein
MIRKGIIIGLCVFFIILGYSVATAPFPQNPAVQSYFDKIADMPYMELTDTNTSERFWSIGKGDCHDKALAFKEYLINSGAENVQICWVCRLNDNGRMIPIYDGSSLAHSFVVWNNKVYSPTNDITHRFYNADIKTYQKFLKNTYGFNTWYFEDQIPIPF